MNKLYKDDFYKDRHKQTLYSAKRILNIVRQHAAINSAIDVGCGSGTWLSALGIKDIMGIDGQWVDRKYLEIPLDKFVAYDFAKGIPSMDHRFDLAISLEVAEHISPEDASKFVGFLCSLSDLVLFSAAIPNQGGQGHINEQWPDYWISKFCDKGYLVYDCIRPEIWEDSRIPYWYRQNMFLFSRMPLSTGLSFHGKSLVHPDHYLERTNIYVHQAFKQLISVLKAAIKRKFL